MLTTLFRFLFGGGPRGPGVVLLAPKTIRLLSAPAAVRLLRASKMPSVGDFKPDGSPGEAEPFSIDFAARLATGDSIASVASSLSVHYGADPAASSRLTGSAYFVGTVASQALSLSGLLPGVTYNLAFTVTTAKGSTLVDFGRIACAAIL